MKVTKNLGRIAYTAEEWDRFSCEERNIFVEKDIVPTVKMATIDYIRMHQGGNLNGKRKKE